MNTSLVSERSSKFTWRAPRTGGRRKRGGGWKWVRRVVGVVLAVAVVVALVVAWLPEPSPVDVAHVTEGPLRVTVDEDGRARVKDRFVVSSPLSGRIGRVELDPGDMVEEGQVLARVVPTLPPLMDERTRSSAEARVAAAEAARSQVAAQLERAQANLQYAQTEAGRERALAEAGAISPAALDRAVLEERTSRAEVESLQFAARVSRHELEMARAALRRAAGVTPEARGESLDIVSPVAGRVLSVARESEGVVQPGEGLVEVGDPEALELVIDVLTTDAVRIEPGAKVYVDDWGGPTLEGRVKRVEPSAFTHVSSLGVEEQRVNVLIEVTSPHALWKSLRDGYRVEASIVVWEDLSVIKVPSSALFRHDEGWALYRIEDESAWLTPVEIGERTASEVQILSPMSAGTPVVVYPSESLVDGAAVEAR